MGACNREAPERAERVRGEAGATPCESGQSTMPAGAGVRVTARAGMLAARVCAAGSAWARAASSAAVVPACVSATAGACPREPGQRVGEGGVECSVPRACRPPQVLFLESHHPSPNHHRGEYVLECASVCEPSQGSVGQCVHASRDAQYECEQNPRVLRKGRGSKETWEARLYQLAGIAVSATREPACAGPEGSPGANRWARAIARRPSAQRE